MWLSDSYDVPQEVVDGPHSPAFREFLLTWFGSTRPICFGLPDLTVLKGLTTDEIARAQQLIRRNLKCRRIHIINATWALRDTSAVPLLRMMLDDEPNPSRRLTIAGALWKLVRDQVFIECLGQLKGTTTMVAHIGQVLWLDDERAIDLLVELLPADDDDRRRAILIRLRSILRYTPLERMVHQLITRHGEAQGAGPWALGLLNRLESGISLPPDKRNPPSYYRQRLEEPAFREHILQAIHESNKSPQFDW